MAEITAYTSLASPQADDVLVIVDVHDTSMSPAGTTKKTTAAALLGTPATFIPAVTALTFGATISINASAGNVFTVTLTASTGTFANPSNPADGQVIRLRVTQDATGGRTASWGTAYDWGSTGGTPNAAPTLSTAASATDILGFEYDAALSKWCYLGAPFPQGF